ncbi:N-formylglutamate deformylase [Sphingomonas sp. LaA6.9]|uniref:N-formylglutamate deformylase n=1 Tax=Sphingomonas sp. LaA6.9 TaxID=2919914 RepID=UPI001F502C24|nr:N-formylglutamate deformylase [Sphingomonas sp. LaA6.9]MCJ8158277.1 N-formylglutamate deformylase [Sphingomonas sp. LaA6.9]
MIDWLTVTRGDAPLIVSVPHAGTHIPADIGAGLVSTTLGAHDADLYVDRLYAFATDLGATVISTAISRTAIDMNRDPSGASLYPGQATTGLCPTETFDGEPLYQPGHAPDEAEIARRRELYFTPYHDAIAAEIERLRALHRRVVLYDAHSIRSVVPRLFDGELPQFNIGTNGGASCDTALTAAVEAVCDASGQNRVTNGRFKGGWITRHYGSPEADLHTIQMELAMRGYLDEAAPWPPEWDATRAQPMQQILKQVLTACLTFAKGKE